MSVEQIIALNAALAELSDLYVAARRFTALRARAESAFLPALTSLGRRLRTLARDGQLSDDAVAEAAHDMLGLSAEWSVALQGVRQLSTYREAHAALLADDQSTLATVIPLLFAGLRPRPCPPALYTPFSPSSGHRKPGTSPFLDPEQCADRIEGVLCDGVAAERDPGAWWQQDLPSFTCVDDPAGAETPIALGFDPAALGLAVFENAEEHTCVIFAHLLVGPFVVSLCDDATDEWWTAYDSSYREFREALERELRARGCVVQRVVSPAPGGS